MRAEDLELVLAETTKDSGRVADNSRVNRYTRYSRVGVQEAPATGNLDS